MKQKLYTTIVCMLAAVCCHAQQGLRYKDQTEVWCVGNHVGNAYIWVTPDGYLKISNNAEIVVKITVNITTNNGTTAALTCKVPPTGYGDNALHNCGKISDDSNVHVIIKKAECVKNKK